MSISTAIQAIESVDKLLDAGGYSPDSSARHTLAIAASNLRDSSPWRRVSEELPPRNQPVLIAWDKRSGRIFDVGKFTGRRWLETVPDVDNEEFMVPDYWQPIAPLPARS